MNKNILNNFYLYNQTTREKNKMDILKKNGLISNQNNIFNFNYNRNNSSQVPYNLLQTKYDIYNNYIDNLKRKKRKNSSEMNDKKENSKKKNKNYFYSTINFKDLNCFSSRNNPINYNNDNDKDINTFNYINNNYQKEIQQNNIKNKKKKYQRCNSLAYIKKRPNDLMKSQNLENNSVIYNKFFQNTFRTKGRCLSCTNIKKSFNILNNNDIDKISTFEYDNNINNLTTYKKFVNPLNIKNVNTSINNFSVKKQNFLMNKKLGINFCNYIFNVIKKHLISKKIIFFKKLKSTRKNLMYEVTVEEYKFLEELKGLGVTNKKQLNLLLKDIYVSIKGNNGNNED